MNHFWPLAESIFKKFRSVFFLQDYVIGNVRPVHTLEFVKHHPFAIALHNRIVPSLPKWNLELDVHRFFLALSIPFELITDNLLLQCLLLQLKTLLLKFKLIYRLAFRHRSISTAKYRRWGSTGVRSFYMKLCIFLMIL